MKPFPNAGTGWLWAPLIAVQFLTRIPILFIPDHAYDAPAWGRRKALIFFPLVGLPVGGLGAAVWTAATMLHLPPLAAAVLAAASTALVTGAFHEDGLADTADALGPHDRAKSLDVMRDSRIGTFGSVALWAMLTLKVAALTALPAHAIWLFLPAAHVLARWSSLPLALWLPDARRAHGLGADHGSLIGAHGLTAATLLTLACVLLLVGLHSGLRLSLGAALAVFASGLFYQTRFGGVTGDCFGATNQIVETLALLLAAQRLS